MRGKIFRIAFAVGISVLLVCGVLFCFLQYSYYEEAAFDELAVEAEYVVHGMQCSGTTYLETLKPEARITWVAADGQVLFDSVAEPSAMENHKDREEIRQAMLTGSGKSNHYSETVLEKTLYYALRMEDGSVLRLCCKQSSAAAVLVRMLQPIFWVLALVLVLSGILAFRLAKQLTRPINEIDLDNPQIGRTYQELTPLVERIREQNLTIREQMDELGTKQREFAAITENMSEGFLLIDGKRRILSGNPSAHLLLAGGQEATELNEETAPAALLRAADAALSGERTVQTLDTPEQNWQVIANPVTAHGQVTGAAILIMDVTEREQREALRREFSANVSHELKTPLTSISGFAELMVQGLVPTEKAKEFAGDIYRESQRLIALVDDIIKLSKLDEDSAPVERETVELYELCSDVLDSLRAVAAQRGVTLQLTGDAARVKGVWQILNEMVYNLCDNAIKYNRTGGSVRVRVVCTASEIRLSVEDTGIGIPYAHQSRVFERFYRVDKSHSKQIGGTGLGLSIVKHGAAYHNARLELKSEPEVGTTITVVFPRKKEEQ